MLLINPSPAEALTLLPAGTSPVVPTHSPGGRIIALSTDGPSVRTATATHVGTVYPDGRTYHGRQYHDPIIEWTCPKWHYALQYNETLKCWQVAGAADEYALPADHSLIPAGLGALLSTVYTRSTARIGGTGNDGYTLFRLDLPHTLDGLSGMFQDE